MNKFIAPLKFFNKTITVPSDKSITHRAIMFLSLCGGGKIYNPLLGDDCLSTIDCMKKLGANISIDNNIVNIFKGADFKSSELFVGNSGTTMRLLSGCLAGKVGSEFILDGDDSIRGRPMNRVIKPLSLMGGKIMGDDGKAPLKITGAKLNGIEYDNSTLSAQVKSAVLLAGLSADGQTIVSESVKSRDHTERMLEFFNADIKVNENVVTVKKSILKGRDVSVVGDISSAAFMLCLTAGLKGGFVKVKNVGINETRDGVLRVLKQMGANVLISNQGSEFEPYGDIELEFTKLKPFKIDGGIMPLLIDEIPILAVLAATVEGQSVISGAGELKVKESNRIDTVVNNLKNLGVDIVSTDDGMIIKGQANLKGAALNSRGDHRIAMSLAIAAAIAR